MHPAILLPLPPDDDRALAAALQVFGERVRAIFTKYGWRHGDTHLPPVEMMTEPERMTVVFYFCSLLGPAESVH